MAILKKKNTLIDGFSGRFGDNMMIRRYKDKTILSPMPNRRKKKASPELQHTRDKFLEATFYAKSVKAIPQAILVYKQIAKLEGYHSAYTAAITDFMSTPVVKKISNRNYKGKLRIEIALEVNSFAKEIIVSLFDVNGMETEGGKASFAFGDKTWRYAPGEACETLSGRRILIQIKTWAGRTSKFEKTF